MYKQIYRKTDGTPELIQDRYDEESEVSIYEYDKDLYTDFTPPSNLYQPIQFSEETNEWVGATREEWLDTLPEQEPDNPNSHDFLNAQLLANDLEHNSKIEDLQQDIANLTAELLKAQGGMSDVHDS